MKKVIALALALPIFLVGCTKPTPPVEHQQYTAQGHYYADGTVVTNDGNVWGYATDTISDGQAVYVGFDDNGTPNDITDDIIFGLVWDKTTSIYDQLENALSDKFELERDGNNIKILGGHNND